MGRGQINTFETFQDKFVILENGCWKWLLYITKNGYGHVCVNRKQLFAHRYSYELYRGKIPNGLVIDHLCRNRWCVNPEHLEPVTNLVNIRRGKRAAKTHCIKGHEFTEENTIKQKRGRACRRCMKAYLKSYNKTYVIRKRQELLAKYK